MEELVKTIAASLVDDQDAVDVSSQEIDGEIVIELRVADADMGKIIGRHGRIAKAIRNVVKGMAMKDDKKVSVKIVG